MPFPKILTEYCKGCRLCVVVCPKNVLEISEQLSEQGVNPAFPARPADCIGCLSCYMVCPDAAVEVYTEAKPAKTAPAAAQAGAAAGLAGMAPEKGSDTEKVSDTQAEQGPPLGHCSGGVSDTFSVSDPATPARPSTSRGKTRDE